MPPTRISLRQYSPVHVLAAVGVAVAIAAVAGALLAGTSVQASLRELALQRLGATDLTIGTTTSFGGRLGAAMVIAAPDTIVATTSLIAVTGTVRDAASGRVAENVLIYGVDQTFWDFHGVPPVILTDGDAALSEPLAAALDAADGADLIVRAHGPWDVAIGTLPARRADPGTAMRVTMVRTLEASRMGEFALQPQPRPVAALFVPLTLLQRELKLPGRVNTILVRHARRAGEPSPDHPPVDAIRRAWLAGAALPDFGVRIRRVPGDRVMALEGLGGPIDPPVAARVIGTLNRLQRPAVPALGYLATAIRVGDRAIPYSTVSAIDIDAYNRLSVPAGPPAPGSDAMSNGEPLVRGSLEVRVGRGGARVGRVQVGEAERRPASAGSTGHDATAATADPVAVAASEGPLWLNEWAAADLGARAGDAVQIEYVVRTDRGGFDTRQATFTMQGVVPMMRVGGDPTLIPEWPGISDAPDLGAWQLAFSLDASPIRPIDEAYWDQWRTAPKAFLPLEIGQRLWASHAGDVSSIRFALRDSELVAAAVREELSSRVSLRPVREEALAAVAGASDVGRDLAVSSVFLLVAALLVAYLSFALGVEQRAREAGLLLAVGFPASRLRRVFFAEGLGVVLAGTVVGAGAAAGYAAIVVHGLRTWWADAVGAATVRLHLDPLTLAAGTAGGAAAAAAALWLATGVSNRQSPRALIGGRGADASAPPASWRRSFIPGLVLVIAAAGLRLAAEAGALAGVSGYVGAGGALLAGGLLLFSAGLRWRRFEASTAPLTSVWTLGMTHAAWRPGRTAQTAAVIASATFILIAFVNLRPATSAAGLARHSGTGGFSLLVESAAPLMHDPATPAGRAALGLDADAQVIPLRLRPGDDASRLAPYQPRNPRVVGVVSGSLEGRFAFADAAAAPPGTSAWQLLDQPPADAAVPAIVDRNTLTHVLHLEVGDVFSFAPDGIAPVRFRIVAALADSVLQSEILIGEDAFVRLFPRDEGYRIWLIDTAEEPNAQVSAMIADRLADTGVEVTEVRDRLASYRQVTDAYRRAFHALGTLGLLFGALGVGAVLARNRRERQREWGWLRVAGYRPAHLRRLVIAESAVMLVGGVLIGTLAAAVATAPGLSADPRAVPLRDLTLTLLAVIGTGLAAALVAGLLAEPDARSAIDAE